MTAAFLQEELAEELGKILSGIRLRNPQGEMSSIHIFEQLLPMPEPSDEEKIPEELLVWRRSRQFQIRIRMLSYGSVTERSKMKTVPKRRT